MVYPYGTQCFVAGLQAADQITTDCLPQGAVRIDDTGGAPRIVPVSNSVPTNPKAALTLRMLSTNAYARMPSSGKAFFEQFKDYYNSSTYSDDFVMEALGDPAYDKKNKFDGMVNKLLVCQ